MVYCGKPSRSCRQCRKRDIKCDKRAGSCGQCTRANLKCPGYQNPEALVFRDQTASTIQKAADAPEDGFRKMKFTNYDPSVPSLSPCPTDLTPYPLPPVELRAKDVFVSQYVLRYSSMMGYIPHFLPSMYKPIHLMSTFKAVSLLYFSNEVMSPSVLDEAWTSYGFALSLTNKALQQPQAATQNSTLLTIFLLDLFERLANKRQLGMISDTRHINGALALFRLRGQSLFDDPLAVSMFSQLKVLMLTSCLEHNTDVPNDFIEIHKFASHSMDVEHPDWSFSVLLIRFIGVKARVCTRDNLSDAVQSALQLDDDFEQTCMNMPRSWHFDTITGLLIPDLTYEGCYHHYPSAEVCRTWNNYRLIRILLNEIILELLQNPEQGSFFNTAFVEAEQKIHTCNLTIERMCNEICASLPQFTREPSCFAVGANKTAQSAGMYMHGQISTSQRRSQATALVFALYTAASSPTCSSKNCSWIVNELQIMGSEMNISEARIVKDILLKKGKVNPWVIANTLELFTFGP
ncbi:hypothetical protein BP5796_08391 [Coleophoma crateriformis]|uniref:Zn(2)-C6 fungal-type domain-containing protein n=1 Tax=Coleophoma crateriformis TaxID=565419 RepID=A0A3D8R830_9HELO|nr:hypothetical protein BP5796_08391 [Coleophoma crateriformis]